MARQIPGAASHFVARDAEIYLPSAALHDKNLRLPVLELLHGTPGGPTAWPRPDLGNLLPTVEAFARAHGGRTPIVVMPDLNGSIRADTECIRTPSGANVEQYLADVVPAWIAAHLPASTNHHDWAIAGLSEGGTCSLMLALRHRATWTTVGDFSGVAHLSVGEPDVPARTLRVLFNGSQSAYNEHDPIWLLDHSKSLSGLGIWMQSGAKDHGSVVAQNQLAAKARAKGATVQNVLYPGIGHGWAVWANAIQRMLPWYWNRISA